MDFAWIFFGYESAAKLTKKIHGKSTGKSTEESTEEFTPENPTKSIKKSDTKFDWAYTHGKDMKTRKFTQNPLWEVLAMRTGAPGQGVGARGQTKPEYRNMTQTLSPSDGYKGQQPPRSEQSPDPSPTASASSGRVYRDTNSIAQATGTEASGRPEVNRAPTRVHGPQPPLDECVMAQTQSLKRRVQGLRPPRSEKSSDQRTPVQDPLDECAVEANDASKNK